MLLFFTFIFSVFILNCTESPFGEDSKISGNSISGKVQLNNSSNNKDIYIWFKELNRSTRTDSNGFFTLNLPSPSVQTGGGIDGIFDLYFYVANYQWQSVPIALSNGKVQYSEEVLDNNGELKAPVILIEILNISVSFTFGEIPGETARMIFANFTLRAKGDPVKVTTDFSHTIFRGDPKFSTGLLLDSNEQFVKLLKRENRGLSTGSVVVGNISGTLPPVIIYTQAIPSGNYRAIPYLLIEQKDLPAGLLASIDEDAWRFSPEFLQIPLRVKNNEIKINSPIP